ncbi:hypothetical protein [Paraburkholderia azotifigens]|uniref:hypothetical protein n=1 Tax=Paraburkholderia azotifigens TaxID=2057004 RepID=UPI003B8A6261
MIPPGTKPIPLSVFAADAPVSVSLSPQMVSLIGTKAILAVSLNRGAARQRASPQARYWPRAS